MLQEEDEGNMVTIQFKNVNDTITFSSNLLKQFKISFLRLILKIGAWKKELFVEEDDQLPENTVCLPLEISKTYTIPEDLSYDIVIKNRTLSLGPVIAVVAHLKKQSPKRLDLLRSRFKEYEKIKGLIYVCAARSINIENKTIEGYYYNPSGTNPDTRWINGIFPYPDVVYKRHPIDLVRQNDLVSQIGDHVINSYYFSKGDLPGIISNNKELQKYFPLTNDLRNSEQLVEMVSVYKSAYLKPRDGAQGRGILYVTKDNEGKFIFRDRFNKETLIEGEERLSQFLAPFIKKEYIIQQNVATQVEERNVDFRVYVQKNGLKKWQCQGMIGRMAKKQTIITNLKYVEKLLTGIDALKWMFQLNDEDACHIQQSIFHVCVKICTELDKRIGQYGDVAIDCIVDDKLNIWILEINKLYGYESLRRMNDRKLIRTLLTTPFQYAKALAGF